MNLLRARNLSKSFGGVQAVQNVDFALQQGEIRAIIGPNGAGKTTFVNLLSGRVIAAVGSIEFRGQDITRMPIHQRVRKGIAYTFQITSIFPSLTVLENVAIAAQNCFSASSDAVCTDDHTDIHRANLVLQQVGIANLKDETAGNIAYGHQRLLEVAMGLALNPLLLIFDEPTQGLSDVEIEDFCKLVKQINQSTTVLLIEHNMSVVMSLAHSITVFDSGQVLAHGSGEQIRNNAEVQAAYLGR